jgi:hypothetical protein
LNGNSDTDILADPEVVAIELLGYLRQTIDEVESLVNQLRHPEEP